MSTPIDRNDERLLWQLRALRRDATPANDLWPGIAARIAAAGDEGPAVGAATVATGQPGERNRRHGGSHGRRGPVRFAPWALAASLVLAIGVAWQQRPDFGQSAPDPSARLIHREAEAMTREYDAALRELQASAPAPADDTLRTLDRSAAQIRTALTRDPDARFLLDRLRSTYEKRLELTQRGFAQRATLT